MSLAAWHWFVEYTMLWPLTGYSLALLPPCIDPAPLSRLSEMHPVDAAREEWEEMRAKERYFL